MLPICRRHVKAARAEGQEIDSVRLLRGKCSRPGCNQPGFYGLLEDAAAPAPIPERNPGIDAFNSTQP